MDRDSARQILAICHYVYAGLNAVVALAVGGAMWVMFRGLPPVDDPDAAKVFAAMRPVFTAVGVGVVVMVLLHLLLYVAAGRALARRRSWTLCVVAAALALTNLPLGTVLGIFTLMHLVDPGVRAEFDAVKAGRGPAAGAG
ncbi:MAG: hypothetical protein AMXMBFR36_31870 [Acidobacteriota bacterium]